MKDPNQPKDFPAENPEEKYREAGVEGNDQNAAIRNAEKEPGENLGNAEKSERGTAEFNADQGIEDEKPDCQTLSDINSDPSDRGQTEFLD